MRDARTDHPMVASRSASARIACGNAAGRQPGVLGRLASREPGQRGAQVMGDPRHELRRDCSSARSSTRFAASRWCRSVPETGPRTPPPAVARGAELARLVAQATARPSQGPLPKRPAARSTADRRTRRCRDDAHHHDDAEIMPRQDIASACRGCCHDREHGHGAVRLDGWRSEARRSSRMTHIPLGHGARAARCDRKLCTRALSGWPPAVGRRPRPSEAGRRAGSPLGLSAAGVRHG